MSRILVTGGAGFIGSHLCDALLRARHRVIALDNFDDFYDPAVKHCNLSQALQHPHFTLLEGDIRDTDTVHRALRDPVDVVVHLAARAGVRPSIEQPLLYHDVNVTGTLVLLDACRRNGVTKFIFASSSSVYGNNTKVPFAEDDPVDAPISPYAASKRAAELFCHTYHHLYGMAITCLRFFTVYGPRQRPDLAIHKFTRLMHSDQPIPVFGDGGMMRDFTYIDEIIDGVLRAIDRCLGFHIYNLGEARPVSITDLVMRLERILGKKAIINHKPPQPGDVNRTFADITRARRELGYNPTTDLHTGLTRFVEWFLNPTRDPVAPAQPARNYSYAHPRLA